MQDWSCKGRKFLDLESDMEHKDNMARLIKKAVCGVSGAKRIGSGKSCAGANAAGTERHIDVLDGVRALAVGLVVWFHFWQQSWLTPNAAFHGSLSAYLGIQGFGLERFVRCGYQFVDLLILLSAFCNFYPYARSILLQEPWPDTKRFYLKRAARILPSYYLSLLVMLVIMLGEGVSINTFFWKDLVTHIFCISPLFPDTYLRTNFNGVLWTVQIEVLYYVLLPWLAKLFRRWPALTCIGLWSCGLLSSNYIASEKADMIRVLGNQALTFAGCYANGMILCILYITIKRRQRENRYTHLASTAAAFLSVWYLHRMMGQLGGAEAQVVQLQQRFELSLVFSVFLLSLFFAAGWVRFLFANRTVRFIAAVSYNLYIWHQLIAVKCKVYHVPWWEGDTPPNKLGDTAWMWKYQILIVVLSVLVASVLTYGYEKPVAAFLLKRSSREKSRENSGQKDA